MSGNCAGMAGVWKHGALITLSANPLSVFLGVLGTFVLIAVWLIYRHTIPGPPWG